MKNSLKHTGSILVLAAISAGTILGNVQVASAGEKKYCDHGIPNVGCLNSEQYVALLQQRFESRVREVTGLSHGADPGVMMGVGVGTGVALGIKGGTRGTMRAGAAVGVGLGLVLEMGTPAKAAETPTELELSDVSGDASATINESASLGD